jgi:NAD(P)-dependent dehydrogenase (short-subunit alcohol dehydrogenase family)
MSEPGVGGDLVGKKALITGGTTGLGMAMARAFLLEGARVVITGRNEELGRKAEEELRRNGDARFLRADAADPKEVADNVARTVDHLGGLDILVNNAGVGVSAGALGTPLHQFDLVMNVNVRGAFCYAQAAFPSLEESGGCMIHIASDAGVVGEAEIAVYSVSKAALIMLSNMLAIEGGRRGVRSNAICPGDIEPGMRHMVDPDGTAGDEGPPEEQQDEQDVTEWPIPPVGRIGRSSDVAEAAVYLASERSSFVNGVALLVDGGMRAGMRTATYPNHASAG